MGKPAIRWLYGQLPGLVERGVLTEDVAGRWRRHCGEPEPVNRLSIALGVFSVLGAVFIGLGLIPALAHKWEEMSWSAGTVLSFAPLTAGQALAAFALVRRPGSTAWPEGAEIFLGLSIGASISLIAQTYHISGDSGRFIVTRSLLGLPMVYELRAIYEGQPRTTAYGGLYPLSGKWQRYRECHIGGDFLLAYKLNDRGRHGLVVFVRAGTHADLFE